MIFLSYMQYFTALQMGKKRVEKARKYLNKLCNDKAMPALALRDNKTNVWEPVGEENLYAFINESSGFVLTDTSGFILALCDKNGISKAIVQGVSNEQRENFIKIFEEDKILEYIAIAATSTETCFVLFFILPNWCVELPFPPS